VAIVWRRRKRAFAGRTRDDSCQSYSSAARPAQPRH